MHCFLHLLWKHKTWVIYIFELLTIFKAIVNSWLCGLLEVEWDRGNSVILDNSDCTSQVVSRQCCGKILLSVGNSHTWFCTSLLQCLDLEGLKSSCETPSGNGIF